MFECVIRTWCGLCTLQLKERIMSTDSRKALLEMRAKRCWALEPGNDKNNEFAGNSHAIDNSSHLLWVFQVLVWFDWFSTFTIFHEANSLPITRTCDKIYFLWRSDSHDVPMPYSITVPLIKLTHWPGWVEWLSTTVLYLLTMPHKWLIVPRQRLGYQQMQNEWNLSSWVIRTSRYSSQVSFPAG